VPNSSFTVFFFSPHEIFQFLKERVSFTVFLPHRKKLKNLEKNGKYGVGSHNPPTFVSFPFF